MKRAGLEASAKGRDTGDEGYGRGTTCDELFITFYFTLETVTRRLKKALKI